MLEKGSELLSINVFQFFHTLLGGYSYIILGLYPPGLPYPVNNIILPSKSSDSTPDRVNLVACFQFSLVPT